MGKANEGTGARAQPTAGGRFGASWHRASEILTEFPEKEVR